MKRLPYNNKSFAFYSNNLTTHKFVLQSNLIINALSLFMLMWLTGCNSFSSRQGMYNLICCCRKHKSDHLHRSSSKANLIASSKESNTISTKQNRDLLIMQDKVSDINIQDNGGHTALIQAVQDNNTTIVSALLACPDINAQDPEEGDTALMKAVQNNNTTMVAALLAHSGIKLNLKNKQGNTALMQASQNNNTTIVRALLAHPDIDINVKDNEGHTACTKVNIRPDRQDVTDILFNFIKSKEKDKPAKDIVQPSSIPENERKGYKGYNFQTPSIPSGIVKQSKIRLLSQEK